MMEPTVLVTAMGAARSSHTNSLMNITTPSGMTRMLIHLTRFCSARIISDCCGFLARLASCVRRET